MFSSLKKTGMDEAEQVIGRWLVVQGNRIKMQMPLS
jgi:hypothetical protein